MTNVNPEQKPLTSDSSNHPDPKQAAAAAVSETANVAHTAVDASKDVAHEVKAQAADVVGQAKDQVAAMMGQARSELKTQADIRAEQAAGGLQTFADQLAALSEGRPDEAGHVGALVDDAQQRVSAYALTLQDRGPQALIDDLASFARRRPLAFLAGAAVAGFAAGRLARATAAVQHDESPSDDSGTWAAPVRSTPIGLDTTTQDYVTVPASTMATTPGLGSALS